MIFTSFKFIVCADLLFHSMAFIIALALKHSFYLCFDLSSFEAPQVYFLNYPPPSTPQPRYYATQYTNIHCTVVSVGVLDLGLWHRPNVGHVNNGNEVEGVCLGTRGLLRYT